jgi:hypothetical protein
MVFELRNPADCQQGWLQNSGSIPVADPLCSSRSGRILGSPILIDELIGICNQALLAFGTTDEVVPFSDSDTLIPVSNRIPKHRAAAIAGGFTGSCQHGGCHQKEGTDRDSQHFYLP